MIRCLIIDDEPIARKGLETYVAKLGTLQQVASCDGALEARKVMESQPIDLIFLDIQMPDLTGIEFLKTMINPPLVIITTAYSNFALEGYELDVLDYLLKPISFERFIASVNKAKDYLELQYRAKTKTGAEFVHDFVFVKCGNRYEKIMYDDILFVEAMQNYVTIFTSRQKYITHITFKAVESHLPSSRFLKVQKSYIINVTKIDSIEGTTITIGKNVIPISRDNREEILALILNNKLLKR